MKQLIYQNSIEKVKNSFQNLIKAHQIMFNVKNQDFINLDPNHLIIARPQIKKQWNIKNKLINLKKYIKFNKRNDVSKKLIILVKSNWILQILNKRCY